MLKELTITELRTKWQFHRAVMDKLIRHPEYRYNSMKTHLRRPLLNLSRYIANEMAHYNMQYWRKRDSDEPKI